MLFMLTSLLNKSFLISSKCQTLYLCYSKCKCFQHRVNEVCKGDKVGLFYKVCMLSIYISMLYSSSVYVVYNISVLHYALQKDLSIARKVINNIWWHIMFPVTKMSPYIHIDTTGASRCISLSKLTTKIIIIS